MTQGQFIARMKNVLQYNATYRDRVRERSGLVDNKNLAKAHTGRIFKKKHEFTDKSYRITLMLDDSGSMFRGPSTILYNTLPHLIDALDASKIPYRIILYSMSEVLIKDWKDTMSPKDVCDLHKSITQETVILHSNGTDLIDSLQGQIPGYEEQSRENMGAWNDDWLHISRVLRTCTSKDIVLVLSDGEPGNSLPFTNSVRRLGSSIKTLRGSRQDLKTYTSTEQENEKFFANLTKHTKVPCIGIGLGTSYVKRYYRYWGRADDAHTLFKEITRNLSKIIKKA